MKESDYFKNALPDSADYEVEVCYDLDNSRLFKAKNKLTGEYFAFKVFKTGSNPQAETDWIAAERQGMLYHRELSSRDSRVVKIYPPDDLTTARYIKMEWVEGWRLDEFLGQDHLFESLTDRPRLVITKFVVEIALQILEVLQKADDWEGRVGNDEKTDIIHGDLKPENLMINVHGNLRILDFGVAKARSKRRSRTYHGHGTYQYMAPERIPRVAKDPMVDKRADLWSVGVILFEYVANILPFPVDPGEAELDEIRDKLIRHRNGAYTFPHLPSGCPEGLKNVIFRALKFHPNQRFASASAMRTSLEAVYRSIAWPTLSIKDLAKARISLDDNRRDNQISDGKGHKSEDDRESRKNIDPQLDQQSILPLKTITQRTESRHKAGTTKRTGDDEEVEAVGGNRAQQGNVASNGGQSAATPSLSLSPIVKLLLGASTVLVLFLALIIAFSLISRNRPQSQNANSTQASIPNEVPVQEVSKKNEEQLLVEQLVSRADIVINKFNEASMSEISEDNWNEAQDNLHEALKHDPTNREIEAKLHYCTGQIERMNGIAWKKRPGMSSAATLMLNNSVSEMESALRIKPNWADPMVALTITYLYGLGEIEKAINSINEAEKMGFQGERKTAILGDAMQMSGDKIMKQLNKGKDSDSKKRLTEARIQYQQSLEFYQAIEHFGNAADSISKVQNKIAEINKRLGEPD
jgi:serine/threonine protein kinase